MESRSTNGGPVAAYLRRAGLESLSGREAEVERAIRDLMEAMGEKVHADPASLYSYPVPMLTQDGTCSVVDEMAPVPYDLTAILGGRTEQTTRRLALLERLVERTQETTGADWVGIYQRRANSAGVPVLVKVADIEGGDLRAAESDLQADGENGAVAHAGNRVGRRRVK